jgi:hypothetical protein
MQFTITLRAQLHARTVIGDQDVDALLAVAHWFIGGDATPTTSGSWSSWNGFVT